MPSPDDSGLHDVTADLFDEGLIIWISCVRHPVIRCLTLLEKASICGQVILHQLRQRRERLRVV